jgi:hypothetical protein
MSEPKGALTEAMFDKLEYLKGKATLTEKQNIERIELQFRMDNYDPTELSKGCMLYLVFIYMYMKYGSQKNKWSKSEGVPRLIRGTVMEKNSFEIVKRATGHDLYRHKSLLKNKFLKGQLDVIDAKTVADSTKVIDIKTAYSQFDFMKVIHSKNIARSINFQLQGYLALTGKEYGEVYYCLADFTDEAIAEQRSAMFKLLCPDGMTTESFLEEWAQVEDSMRFNHIPDEERVIVFKVERDEKVIAKIYEKIEFCREWLAGFEAKHQSIIADQQLLWHQQQSISESRRKHG